MSANQQRHIIILLTINDVDQIRWDNLLGVYIS